MSTNTTPTVEEEQSLRQRIAENPRPALVWGAVAFVLLALEFGALVDLLVNGLPWNDAIGGVEDVLGGTALAFIVGIVKGIGAPLASAGSTLADAIPTLLNRNVIDNSGWWTGSSWEGTTLGLAPHQAWMLRVGLIYAYSFVWLYWLWRGYLTFREHYRYAEWTPFDDVVDRLRGHRWGQFGLITVTLFVIMAMFAPALGPTTVDKNIMNPYSNNIKYYDQDAGRVVETTVGDANLNSASRGSADSNYGINSYDDFDRYHPFGTMHNGKDLFTFMAAGARVSLTIGLIATGLGTIIALMLAMMTAYYKGLYDLVTVVTSDAMSSMPFLLVLIMFVVVLKGTWLAKIYSGGLLIALIAGFFSWPGYWRSVRGPALAIVENEWIDAAESFGQAPTKIMRKHIAPYVVQYLLIYASMSIGGVIIGVAGLTFLGIGITQPTPEWGWAVAKGQNYLSTPSWHISILPGVAVVIIVTAFNAMGDGIRDALDPQSDAASSGETAAAGGGA